MTKENDGKAIGRDYKYDGKVVILFGENDGVIRWRDVFPACQHPGNIGQFVEEYKKRDFPMVRGLQVQVRARKTHFWHPAS